VFGNLFNKTINKRGLIMNKSYVLLKRALWYSPLVAALALPAACGKKEKKKNNTPTANTQQLGPTTTTTTPTTPRETNEGGDVKQMNAEASKRLAAITLTVKDEDKLGEKAKNGELSIEFDLSGNLEGVTVECRVKDMNDPKKAEFEGCNPQDSYLATGLKNGSYYKFEVRLTDDKTSMTETLSTDKGYIAVGTQQSSGSENAIFPVGLNYTIKLMPGMRVDQYTIQKASSGGNVVFYQHRGTQSSSAEGSNNGLVPLLDGNGETRYYATTELSEVEFYRTFGDKFSKASLTVTMTSPNSAITLDRLEIYTYNTMEDKQRNQPSSFSASLMTDPFYKHCMPGPQMYRVDSANIYYPDNCALKHRNQPPQGVVPEPLLASYGRSMLEACYGSIDSTTIGWVGRILAVEQSDCAVNVNIVYKTDIPYRTPQEFSKAMLSKIAQMRR
jgi:hypothetical protein